MTLSDVAHCLHGIYYVSQQSILIKAFPSSAQQSCVKDGTEPYVNSGVEGVES